MNAPTDNDIKFLLYRTGHLLHRFGQVEKVMDLPEPPVDPMEELPADTIAKLGQLVLTDHDVKEAVRSYQHFMTPNLEMLIGRHHPHRSSMSPIIDGDIGPATRELFNTPRCGRADYGLAPDVIGEAVGSGNWKRCHEIGEFHAASVKLTNSPPSHLLRSHGSGTVWDAIMQRCQTGYDEIGLRFYFDGRAPVQTELTFVSRGNGWIGLALIGSGLSCQSNAIWLRLDSSYLSGREITDSYINLWAILLMHELGHNCGSQHTSGGIMNPGILNVPPRWIDDPAESRMKGWFGGVKIPSEPQPPVPPIPPGPPPVPNIKEIVGGSMHQIGDIITFACRVK